jgi:hypothetical protein
VPESLRNFSSGRLIRFTAILKTYDCVSFLVLISCDWAFYMYYHLLINNIQIPSSVSGVLGKLHSSFKFLTEVFPFH